MLLQAFRRLPRGAAELLVVSRENVPPEPFLTTYKNLAPNSPELVSLCQSADIFVLPSRAEAFGIAAIEAGAVGLPVIVSDVGGLGSTVVDGETGFLIPADDSPALECRLRQLLDNRSLRINMGQANRKRIVSEFNAATNAQRITEILLDELNVRH